MKKSVILVISIFLLSFACKKGGNTSYMNTTIEIGKGDKYVINNNMSVTLDSVVNDSRCPSNANCVWAGNATVRFTYLNGNERVKFSLNTNSSMRKDTLIQGYNIELMHLSPYPEVGKTIEQKDYKAELKIGKEVGFN